jgi:hypothetical protein
MTRGGRDNLTPGDIGDPVADSIRAEQNADARPHPSEGNKTLECENCGEKSENVERRELVMPSCSRLQQPDKPWRSLCDDCDGERPSLREKQQKKAQKRLDSEHYDDPVAIAFYECGRAKFITKDEPEEPVPPHMQEAAAAPIRCVCGKPLVEVELLGNSSE